MDAMYLPLPSREVIKQLIQDEEFLTLFTFYEWTNETYEMIRICNELNFDLLTQYEEYLRTVAAEYAIRTNLQDDRNTIDMATLQISGMQQMQHSYSEYGMSGSSL